MSVNDPYTTSRRQVLVLLSVGHSVLCRWKGWKIQVSSDAEIAVNLQLRSLKCPHHLQLPIALDLIPAKTCQRGSSSVRLGCRNLPSNEVSIYQDIAVRLYSASVSSQYGAELLCVTQLSGWLNGEGGQTRS